MGPGFSPLDEDLALLPGHFSPAVQAALVRLGTWLPFARVPDEIAFFLRTTVSPETARRLTETVGAALVAGAEAALGDLERTLPAAPAGPPLQQLSADGAMVPLVGGAWAEVKLLTLGTVDAPPATADGPVTIHATALSYFARCTDAETFGRLATVETHRRGTTTAITVAAVVDGAAWLQGFIDLHRPDAVRILDFPHAVEHLAGAAFAAFGPESPRAVAWLARHCHELKHGDPDQVLVAVAALPAPTPEAAALRDQTHAYLATRRDQIAYADFQAAGYPIGDGIVESGNKLVVEARLKGSGMHWARGNVDPLLALRTTVCNDRWDEAWPQSCAQRRRQARARTHQRRQQRQATVPAAPPSPVTVVVPAPPARPKPSRAPLVVDGKPRPDHPWHRFHLPGSPDFRQPATK